MPQYCFTNSRGETVDQYFRTSEAPSHITINGERYKRDFRAEMPEVGRAFRPYVSRVPDKHDPFFNQHDKQGRPVVESRRQQNEYARKRGLEWT